MKEVRSLTGVRAIACLLVIVHHYVNYSIPIGFFSQMLYHCYLVVDLFFVLSGYVMAMTYGDMFENGTTFGIWASFMGRRVARVYPMYTAMAVLLVVLVLAGFSDRISVASLPLMFATNILLVQSWFGLHSLEWPMWSISAEWATYIVFPVLLWAAFGRRSVAVATTAVALLAILILCLVPGWTLLHPERHGALNHSFTWWGMMSRCAAEFVLGLVSFRVARTPFGNRLATSRYAGLAIALAIVALLAWPIADMLIVPLMPLMVIAISQDRGPLSTFLAWRPIHRCGVWSYSLYLLHPLFRHLCWRIAALLQHAGLSHTPALLIAIVPVTLLVVAASSVTFRTIEKPGRRFLQDFFTSRSIERAARAAGSPLKHA